ncbi:MAG: universal stress protein [candidate division NC10 bacterium]|nr:universal stress protein [candidate division NC10 bacterium]
MIPTIQKVMVTTDFSDLGNGAIPHAYSLLADREGTVILCHILEPPALPSPLYAHYSPGGALSPEDRERLRQGLLQALEQLVPSEVRKSGRIVTQVRVVETLEPVSEAICQEAKVLGVDIIVIASHGHSGVARLFLGSVAERVLRLADRPVLIVRNG